MALTALKNVSGTLWVESVIRYFDWSSGVSDLWVGRTRRDSRGNLQCDCQRFKLCTFLFNSICETGKIPTHWPRSTFIILPKNDERLLLRLISYVLNAFFRIVLTFIARMLSQSNALTTKKDCVSHLIEILEIYRSRCGSSGSCTGIKLQRLE